jgi:hypothetical protein
MKIALFFHVWKAHLWCLFSIFVRNKVAMQHAKICSSDVVENISAVCVGITKHFKSQPVWGINFLLTTIFQIIFVIVSAGSREFLHPENYHIFFHQDSSSYVFYYGFWGGTRIHGPCSHLFSVDAEKNGGGSCEKLKKLVSWLEIVMILILEAWMEECIAKPNANL